MNVEATKSQKQLQDKKRRKTTGFCPVFCSFMFAHGRWLLHPLDLGQVLGAGWVTDHSIVVGRLVLSEFYFLFGLSSFKVLRHLTRERFFVCLVVPFFPIMAYLCTESTGQRDKEPNIWEYLGALREIITHHAEIFETWCELPVC